MVAHLTNDEVDYFTKWIRLLHVEWDAAKQSKGQQALVWSVSAEQRLVFERFFIDIKKLTGSKTGMGSDG